MDFNYLCRRHQASLVMAANAACDEARRAHRELAGAYASLIVTAETRHLLTGQASWNG